MQKRLAQWILWIVALAVFPALGAEEAAGGKKIIYVVNPLVGWDRNELEARGPGGVTTTEKDTALEYGLFAMAAHPNLVVNNFLFFSDNINDSDVFGNLFYGNYYYDADAVLTPNVGVGYLYHKIEPPGMEIEVHDPMLKLGVRWRVPALHLSLNPYGGYAWERVNTTHGDQDNDSYLYGLTVDWRWRMLCVNLKYYYQDSQEIDRDFHNFHGRLDIGIRKNVGISARVDVMEHSVDKNKSFLIGPAFVF